MFALPLFVTLAIPQGQASPDIAKGIQLAIVASLAIADRSSSTGPVFIDSASFRRAATGPAASGVNYASIGDKVGAHAVLRSDTANLIACTGGCHVIEGGLLVQATRITRTGDSLIVRVHLTWNMPLYVDGKQVSLGSEGAVAEVLLVRGTDGYSVRKTNRFKGTN